MLLTLIFVFGDLNRFFLVHLIHVMKKVHHERRPLQTKKTPLITICFLWIPFRRPSQTNQWIKDSQYGSQSHTHTQLQRVPSGTRCKTRSSAGLKRPTYLWMFGSFCSGKVCFWGYKIKIEEQSTFQNNLFNKQIKHFLKKLNKSYILAHCLISQLLKEHNQSNLTTKPIPTNPRGESKAISHLSAYAAMIRKVSEEPPIVAKAQAKPATSSLLTKRERESEPFPFSFSGWV